jgi:hypothetical protein
MDDDEGPFSRFREDVCSRGAGLGGGTDRDLG